MTLKSLSISYLCAEPIKYMTVIKFALICALLLALCSCSNNNPNADIEQKSEPKVIPQKTARTNTDTIVFSKQDSIELFAFCGLYFGKMALKSMEIKREIEYKEIYLDFNPTLTYEPIYYNINENYSEYSIKLESKGKDQWNAKKGRWEQYNPMYDPEYDSKGEGVYGPRMRKSFNEKLIYFEKFFAPKFGKPKRLISLNKAIQFKGFMNAKGANYPEVDVCFWENSFKTIVISIENDLFHGLPTLYLKIRHKELYKEYQKKVDIEKNKEKRKVEKLENAARNNF